MRKRLPPLFSLQVFEAAARHGKFSLAAQELHLTQSAISRQIKQLEDWSGMSLFTRHGPRVELTEEGVDLLNRMTAPLNALHAAVYQETEQEQVSLHINTLASIATSLILPALPDFISQHPKIQLSIQADYNLTSFPPQIPMVAIRYSRQVDAQLKSHLLFTDRLVVVGNATMVKKLGKYPNQWPADQLLRQSNFDWSNWLPQESIAEQGDVANMNMPHPEGPLLNDANLIIKAAKEGVGLGLVRLSTVWQSLEKNELQLASSHSSMSPSSYYLLYRKDCAHLNAITHFTTWLLAHAKQWQDRMTQFDRRAIVKT